MARTWMAHLPWMIRILSFSPYKILPIGQENKYLGIYSYFYMELYVVCTHKNCLIEAILMSTLIIQSLCRKLKKKFPKLLLFAS